MTGARRILGDWFSHYYEERIFFFNFFFRARNMDEDIRFGFVLAHEMEDMIGTVHRVQ